MKSKNEVSKKINALIEKNIDGYKGFRKASESAKNMHLRDYLMDEASERKEFADELLKSLKNFNPEWNDDAEGSATATLHRSWINFKSLLTGNDDKSILEECMRGDRASVDEYDAFLKEHPSVSDDIKTLIKNQMDKIVNSLDTQFRLEDLS